MPDKPEGVFMTKTEEITNKDIYELLEATHAQATLTNGRVTKLEKRSIGNWVHCHPWRSIVFAIGLFAIVISDIRHPIVGFLKGFF